MANIKFITNGIQNPQGKPRVYFTCHPLDFQEKFTDASQTCFEKICNDVFGIIDCAIYYTPNMSEALGDDDFETLGCMKLFIVPVTTRLLTTSNRTMEVDIPFAKEHHIHFLPIMMEPVPDSLYSAEKNFGKHQYINPFSTDSSEVSYCQKLTRYIKETLVDEAIANKIKDSFGSYIFLSYRKMDRRLAKELMKKIHNIDGYYDIAIWYDEYLVPGEEWDENIKSAMNMVKDKSNLFILLVTSNITKKVVFDGKECDNYVVANEYPNAQRISMHILPAEIENIDYKDLEVFNDIPQCINVHTDDFVATMKEILKSIQNNKNENNPEHLYYIGLAYFNGVDIEMDVERGNKLLTIAAEEGNCEAIEKLINIYRNGDGAEKDLDAALKWAKRLVEQNEAKCETNDIRIIDAKELLADVYYEREEVVEALKIYEDLLEILMNHSADLQDSKVLSIYRKLAVACNYFEDYQKAKGMFWTAYNMHSMNQQEETPESIANFFDFAKAHLNTEQFIEAYKFLHVAHEMYVDAYTENDYRTLSVKEQLALAHCYVGLFPESIEMQESICSQLREQYGNDNPITIKADMSLSRLYFIQQNYEEAVRRITALYDRTVKLFGEENPVSLECLAMLAEFFRGVGDWNASIKNYEKLYDLQKKYYGPCHIKTLQERRNWGITYVMMGGSQNLKRAIDIFSEVLEKQKSVLGAFEIKTLMTMYLIANCHSLLGDNSTAIKQQEKVVELMRKYYKPSHIHAMTFIHYLGCYYYLRYCEMIENTYAYTKEEMLIMLLSAEQYMTEAYAIGKRIYNENHAKNQRIRGDIAIVKAEKDKLCK